MPWFWFFGVLMLGGIVVTRVQSDSGNRQSLVKRVTRADEFVISQKSDGV